MVNCTLWGLPCAPCGSVMLSGHRYHYPPPPHHHHHHIITAIIIIATTIIIHIVITINIIITTITGPNDGKWVKEWANHRADIVGPV